MKMDRRLSNGLAWAGALLVIGIPAADYITGTLAGGGTPSVAVVDAGPQAAVTPAATPVKANSTAEAPKVAPVPQTRPVEVAAASTTGTAVDSFLQSGKPLPSYITDAGSAPQAAKPVVKPAQPVAAPAQPAPAPVAASVEAATPTPAPVVVPPSTEQVAALQPAREAPVPMPLSMRPRPVTVPLATEQPLIIDQAAVPSAPVAPAMPVQEPGIVTADDLADWESGPLTDFLARRGQQSSVTYNVQQTAPPPEYDENGFWLDQGPNGDRPIRRLPRTEDEVYYLPF